MRDLRNRIKGHRKVRLGDLLPHELNPRIHTPSQRQVLQQLYAEVGFARSVLAYELPDGRLKLIDGHLRAALTPDEVVDVEVLDVSDDEARVLLLSIDPLAQLAEYEEEALATIRDMTEKDGEAVRELWKELLHEEQELQSEMADLHEPPNEDKFAIMIICKDEEEQIMLLERFAKEGLACEAKIA